MATAPLQASSEAYTLQATIAAAAVVEARRVEPRGPVAVTQAVAVYQALAAQQASASVAAQVAEQGLTAPATAAIAAASVAGITSAGAPMEAVIPNVSDLGRFVATMVLDAGRSGSSLAITARPAIGGYSRMLGPDSENPCSRCVILAGVVYEWNAAFERHPLCKCIQIPVSEDLPGDAATDPYVHFDSLTAEQQDRAFGKAGAQAIRDGADMNQVVNARSGIERAQVYGRDLLRTTSGTTRRGLFRQRANAAGKKLPIRIMPETIYDLANGDRTEALRLLRLYGFLL